MQNLKALSLNHAHKKIDHLMQKCSTKIYSHDLMNCQIINKRNGAKCLVALKIFKFGNCSLYGASAFVT